MINDKILTIDTFSKSSRLDDLSTAVSHCTLCPRMCHRTKVLSKANGNVASKVLFIAEAPGRLGADKTGIPLYGDRTGDNFDVLLRNIRFERNEIFITNAILCNPRTNQGNNGTPTKNEIENCSSFLEMTINLIKPQVIATLGITALKALNYISPHYYTLQDKIASPLNWREFILFPLYHAGPRALIHRSLSKQRSDYMQLAKIIDPIKGIKTSKQKKAQQQTAINETGLNILQQVVFVIVKHLKQLTYFKLTKLLYLIDLQSIDNIGRSLTGEIFLRQQEGPWIPDLDKKIKPLRGYELQFIFKRRMPLIKLGPSPRFDIQLNDKDLNIIIDILLKYGTMSNAEIKTKTYLTKPMKYILRKEKNGEKMSNATIIYKDKTIIKLSKSI